MVRTLAICGLLALAAGMAGAGEEAKRPEGVTYEVYYFHANWRCVNCTNAETWSKEAVEAVAAANEKGAVAFKPVEMESNQELTKKLKAKRVDAVAVEIKDGKIVRFVNLGNLLELIKGRDAAKAKVEVVKKVTDGLKAFDAKAKAPWLVMPKPEAERTAALR